MKFLLLLPIFGLLGFIVWFLLVAYWAGSPPEEMFS